MSTNVGAVDLELILNSNKFNKEIGNVEKTAKNSGNSIAGSLKKIGIAAAAAFSVKKIFDFGKECIKLGSDLAEVQNVVDVAFPTMNQEINNFAQNAIEQFGLGQTVAKKYMGTFGAMAKAFKFSEKEAVVMSETLTGLAGDVASFYNLSSDESYTKLKSIFTGETETLKELGVVMTQNALDQYAMQNGFGKTTAKMSEQEKTALRYKFVLEQLQLASGDFARTSDSWANQTRVLSLRFNELKATLGQGFINIFTPIVKGINWVIAKLQILADAFKKFTEFMTGKKSESSGIGNVASDVASVTDNANNASNAVDGIGDSAKKTAKKLKSLAAFDTAQILQNNKDDSGSGSGGAGSIDTSGLGDFGKNFLEEANSQMDGFLEKAKELANLFKTGFNEGFGNFDWSAFNAQIDGVKNNLMDIFTSKEVLNAANNCVNSFALYFGRLAGSIGSIGLTIADNLVGGFNKFLEQNKQDLQNHLVRLFDLQSRENEIKGKFAIAVADVFSVFRGDTAKQITADLLAIFTDSFLGISEIVWQFSNDLLYIITQPFNENKDLIKQALQGLLEPISSVLGTIKQAIQDTFAKFWEVYNTYIAPAVENIKNGFSNILGTVLSVWNENIKPILDEWASRFDTLWKEHLQPMVDSFLEFFGKLINGISELWNTWLVPIINWIVENVVPVLAPILETVGNLFMNTFGVIGDILNAIWQILGGLIDFIVGVFTGDWEKAWIGIQSIFSGIWTAIKGIFEGIWNSIKDIVTGAIDTVKAYIVYALNLIASVWGNVWTGISNFVSGIWNGICSIFSGIGQWFSDRFQEAYNGITSIFGKVGDFFSGIWSSICNTFTNLGTNIGNAISDAVKSGINGVIGLIERTINSAINLINGGIDLINLIPGVSVGKIGKLALPRLAQGGYVKANTPRPVIVGDNKQYGEIITPENKMEEIMSKVLKEQGNGNDNRVVALLEELISLIRNLDFDFKLYIDAFELDKRLEKIRKKKQFATNGG